MILDFTVRVKTNPNHPEAEVVKADMVALFKSFMEEEDEEQRRNGLVTLLNILDSVGAKEEYSTETFATITR